jgi:hypothetical protein
VSPERGPRRRSPSGLGRHAPLDEPAADPLDGLVNLFDIGLVLAVAFLIAGLGLSLDRRDHRLRSRATPRTQSQTLSVPTSRRSASGRGTPIGTVYRLNDGQLVLVRPSGR